MPLHRSRILTHSGGRCRGTLRAGRFCLLDVVENPHRTGSPAPVFASPEDKIDPVTSVPINEPWYCTTEMETDMLALLKTIDLALDIYTWILIASAIYSWLYAFNVINSSNRFVSQIGLFLYNVTEPVLRPIRRIMPDLGGIDISPIILLLIIYFLRQLMWSTLAPLLV